MYSNIEIFHIAQSKVNKIEVTRWLRNLGAYDYEIPDVSDPALLVALAAKRCYMSFEPGLNPNVTKVRSDMAEYIDNILKSGHGSVLEHSCHTFAIEGITRVFTAEMNRHRAGWAISEGSLRYIRFRDLKMWLPISIRENTSDSYELAEKKAETRQIFDRALKQDLANYQELIDLWKLDTDEKLPFSLKKQLTSMFRRILPLGIATGGVWTGNLRALRHVITMRADPAAEEEIAYVFSNIAKMMLQVEPFFFKDFEQSPEGFWKPKYNKI